MGTFKQMSVCRGCLASDRRMISATRYEAMYRDLTGLIISPSDGLPQWLCYECSALLEKYVILRNKMIKSYYILYQYVTEGVPFACDQNKSSHLTQTSITHNEFSGIEAEEETMKKKHILLSIKHEMEEVKFENCYDDNITIEEWRFEDHLNKLTSNSSILELKHEKQTGQGEASPHESHVGSGVARPSLRARLQFEEHHAVLEDPLSHIRVERQITQNQVAALTKDARLEHVARKREAHLERMLLPDVLPRKRQTKTISPERQPCIMVNPLVGQYEQFNQLSEIEASTSGVPHTAELKPAESVKFEASTSGVPHPLERCPADDIVIEYEIGAEVTVDAPSSLHTSEPSKIDVNDENFDGVVNEWFQLTEICDSDDELNTEDLDLPASTVHERNAAAEPACDKDLTQFQAEVLQREDNANDHAIKNIVPDDCYTFAWSKDRRTFLGRRETFTGKSGPTFKVTDQTRAIDVFHKAIDFEFIDHLCTETNRYAEQKIALLREQNKLTPHSRFNRWTLTDRDEMVSFLAIIILQGLYPLPEEEAYFRFNGFGTMPYFAKIMSYNRFLLLKTFLNFVDIQTCQDTTRLCKIRPVIDYFNGKFSSLYMPSQEIAIDESLLTWHGRLNFAQKISSKAAQVGVKTYELCESSSGYLWKFFVYAGKDKPTSTTDSTDRQNINDRPDNDATIVASTDISLTGERGYRPVSAKIVYDLIEPLLHRGHTVIMDNFYNSPLLLRSLKRQKTDCYGTLRLNREFVPDSVKTLTKTELRQGEVVATYCSDLAILVWRDANIVSMISTYHNLQIGTQDNYNRVTYKPNLVLDYNKSMGGVDRKDQFLSAQPMERLKNRVWYKKLFCRLYNAAVFNCFVIFSSFHRKISHRQFRTVLAEDLLRRHRQIDLTTECRRLTVRSNTTGQVTTTLVRPNARHKTQARPTVESNHFPMRTGSKYTVCRMCPKKTRTIWKCEECNVNLCIDKCFKAYHKP